MRIEIGGITIHDPTEDQLDRIIQRYGSGIPNRPQTQPAAVDSKSKASPQANGSALPDIEILKLLAGGGKDGVQTLLVSNALHITGKGIKLRAADALGRLGLGSREDPPFENVKIGTARGMRLLPKHREAAAKIIEGSPS